MNTYNFPNQEGIIDREVSFSRQCKVAVILTMTICYENRKVIVNSYDSNWLLMVFHSNLISVCVCYSYALKKKKRPDVGKSFLICLVVTIVITINNFPFPKCPVIGWINRQPRPKLMPLVDRMLLLWCSEWCSNKNQCFVLLLLNKSTYE